MHVARSLLANSNAPQLLFIKRLLQI